MTARRFKKSDIMLGAMRALAQAHQLELRVCRVGNYGRRRPSMLERRITILRHTSKALSQFAHGMKA